jgi:hypothetical protein
MPMGRGGFEPPTLGLRATPAVSAGFGPAGTMWVPERSVPRILGHSRRVVLPPCARFGLWFESAEVHLLDF